MVGTRLPAATMVAVALLLVACGGSDGADTDDPAATGEPTEAAAADGFDFPGDCNDVTIAIADVYDEYAAAMRMFTPDEPIDYEVQIEAVEAAVATAPEQLRDDFERYAAAVIPFYRGLVDMEFDASAPGEGDVDAYAQLVQELDVEAVEEAAGRIRGWAIGPCLEE